MATKSFTTDMRFNRKNAQQLLEALENPNKPKLTSVTYDDVKDKEKIMAFLGNKNS